MSTRCIIRSFVLASASLAIVVWPSISRATTFQTVNVLTYTYGQPNGGLSLGGLNLVNNALIINGAPAAGATGSTALTEETQAAQAAYTYVYGLLATGASDNWAAGNPGIASDSTGMAGPGPGLAYPSAATDPNGLTGIGEVLNDGNGADLYNQDPSWSTWNGVKVNSNSVLVAYTWLGDNDLSGLAQGYDLGFVQNDLSFGLGGGWVNGEYDYSGTTAGEFGPTVQGYEIGTIQNALSFDSLMDPGWVNSTDPSGVVGSASFAGGVAVPEPSTWIMCVLGVIVLGAGALVQRGGHFRGRCVAESA